MRPIPPRDVGLRRRAAYVAPVQDHPRSSAFGCSPTLRSNPVGDQPFRAKHSICEEILTVWRPSPMGATQHV